MLRVFHETVSIQIAEAVDPIEGPLDMRPQFTGEGPVVGALEVSIGEDDEQGRGVHAPVIAAKRHLTGGGHLAQARFVKNLSRLGVPLGHLLLGLGRGEKGQYAMSDFRVQPQVLQGRNEGIAPEGTVEPGYAGIRICPVWGVRDKHAQVSCRAVNPVVELFVRRKDRTRPRFRRLDKRYAAAQSPSARAPQFHILPTRRDLGYREAAVRKRNRPASPR